MSMNADAMNADAFLLPEFEYVTLPSGMPAKLRPPSMLYYLRAGQLPGRLAEMARRGMTQDEIDKATAADGVPDPDDMANRFFLLVTEVFVDPKFSLTPTDGEYHPRRLQWKDVRFVLEWANKYLTAPGGADITPFRSRPESSAVAGAGGEAVGRKAVDVPDSPASGVGV